MIEQVEISNFKCFTRQTIELNSLTILAGANGAGKSSVIQALLLLNSSLASGNMQINPQDIFGVNIGSPTALLAQDFEQENVITISAKSNNEQCSSAKYTLLGLNKNLLECIEKSGTKIAEIQYLTAERIGPRLFNAMGYSEDTIERDGSNASYLVSIADQKNLLVPDELCVDKDLPKFSHNVEKYMRAIIGDIYLSYEENRDNAFIKTMIKSTGMDQPVPQPLTGFGISYVFPIVVAGLFSALGKDTVLIVENPEAHLHPAAQSKIGMFLALVATSGVQVIVETHSEHIIDGARLQLAKQKHTELMTVNFFSYAHNKPNARKINLRENGELIMWPRGFFDQKQSDLRELLNLKRG